MLSRPLVHRGSKRCWQYSVTGSRFQIANTAAVAGLVMREMAGHPILLQRVLRS